MANFAKKFTSQKLFWLFGKSKDDTGMDIGQVLDQFTKKQGVACDGAINGIAFPYATGDPTHRITFETINSVDTMVVRNCSGDVVFSTASGIDPQATADNYRAVLTGTDDANPTAAVTRNDLSAAVVWARTGEGVYTGTLTGAFPAAKTNLQVSLGTGTLAGGSVGISRSSDNVVTIESYDNAGLAADFVGTVNVTITVEP